MAPERARVAFVFPGQGSQAPGMGRTLRESSAAARKVWQAADASYGASLSELTGAGSSEDLQPTDIQQPAIVAASVASLRGLQRSAWRQRRCGRHEWLPRKRICRSWS